MNCEFCNKKFSNRGNLNYHQKTAKFCLALRDETNYKKYSCKFCETSFTRIDNLQTHQETCKQKISFEKDFVNSLNSSSQSLGALNKTVADATTSLSSISISSTEAANYAKQYAKAGDQLASLNAVYETEIQEASKHLKAINGYYGNVNATVEQMASTQKDAENFKSELAKLNANIQSLNQVYGSMLTAMKG